MCKYFSFSRSCCSQLPLILDNCVWLLLYDSCELVSFFLRAWASCERWFWDLSHRLTLWFLNFLAGRSDVSGVDLSLVEDVSHSPRLAILETEWYIVIYSDHEINSTWTMCIMSQESKEIEDILEAHEEMKQEMKQKMRSARWRSANLQSKRSMRSEVQPSTDYSDYLQKNWWELMRIGHTWS